MNLAVVHSLDYRLSVYLMLTKGSETFDDLQEAISLQSEHDAYTLHVRTLSLITRAHIHKNLSALTSQVHTQNLRSCFNLRFRIEEFVGVLRCKIYILNEKAINLSIT